MSRFKFKLKLQGLELEVEGNRDDASLIGRNLGEQLSTIIAPGMGVIEGNSGPAIEVSTNNSEKVVRKSARRKPSGSAAPERKPERVVQFVNDASKYSTPSQSWNTTNKSLWLLYAAREQANTNELSCGQIVQTFNTHFRQAGRLTNSNVARDLGKAKIATPALVGEDTTKTPSPWYLTDEGIRRVQKLIAEALNSRSE